MLRCVGKRGLKVNADKSKVMRLCGEDGINCEIRVDGARLEQVPGFRYLGCAFEESVTDVSGCRRKLGCMRKDACAIMSLVNNMGLQL